VFSDSLASADWGEPTIAAGDLTEGITRLKQERSDRYLLAHGGVRFARSLVQTGLIDEYRLIIDPAALCAGERMFLTPLTIEPMNTIAFQRRCGRPRLRGTQVIEPDRQPGSGCCLLAVTIAEHARAMTRMPASPASRAQEA